MDVLSKIGEFFFDDGTPMTEEERQLAVEKYKEKLRRNQLHVVDAEQATTSIPRDRQKNPDKPLDSRRPASPLSNAISRHSKISKNSNSKKKNAIIGATRKSASNSDAAIASDKKGTIQGRPPRDQKRANSSVVNISKRNIDAKKPTRTTVDGDGMEVESTTASSFYSNGGPTSETSSTHELESMVPETVCADLSMRSVSTRSEVSGSESESQGSRSIETEDSDSDTDQSDSSEHSDAVREGRRLKAIASNRRRRSSRGMYSRLLGNTFRFVGRSASTNTKQDTITNSMADETTLAEEGSHPMVDQLFGPSITTESGVSEEEEDRDEEEEDDEEGSQNTISSEESKSQALNRSDASFGKRNVETNVSFQSFVAIRNDGGSNTAISLESPQKQNRTNNYESVMKNSANPATNHKVSSVEANLGPKPTGTLTNALEQLSTSVLQPVNSSETDLIHGWIEKHYHEGDGKTCNDHIELALSVTSSVAEVQHSDASPQVEAENNYQESVGCGLAQNQQPFSPVSIKSDKGSVTTESTAADTLHSKTRGLRTMLQRKLGVSSTNNKNNSFPKAVSSKSKTLGVASRPDVKPLPLYLPQATSKSNTLPPRHPPFATKNKEVQNSPATPQKNLPLTRNLQTKQQLQGISPVESKTVGPDIAATEGVASSHLVDTNKAGKPSDLPTIMTRKLNTALAKTGSLSSSRKDACVEATSFSTVPQPLKSSNTSMENVELTEQLSHTLTMEKHDLIQHPSFTKEVKEPRKQFGVEENDVILGSISICTDIGASSIIQEGTIMNSLSGSDDCIHEFIEVTYDLNVEVPTKSNEVATTFPKEGTSRFVREPSESEAAKQRESKKQDKKKSNSKEESKKNPRTKFESGVAKEPANKKITECAKPFAGIPRPQSDFTTNQEGKLADDHNSITNGVPSKEIEVLEQPACDPATVKTTRNVKRSSGFFMKRLVSRNRKENIRASGYGSVAKNQNRTASTELVVENDVGDSRDMVAGMTGKAFEQQRESTSAVAGDLIEEKANHESSPLTDLELALPNDGFLGALDKIQCYSMQQTKSPGNITMETKETIEGGTVGKQRLQVETDHVDVVMIDDSPSAQGPKKEKKTSLWRRRRNNPSRKQNSTLSPTSRNQDGTIRRKGWVKSLNLPRTQREHRKVENFAVNRNDAMAILPAQNKSENSALPPRASLPQVLGKKRSDGNDLATPLALTGKAACIPSFKKTNDPAITEENDNRSDTVATVKSSNNPWRRGHPNYEKQDWTPLEATNAPGTKMTICGATDDFTAMEEGITEYTPDEDFYAHKSYRQKLKKAFARHVKEKQDSRKTDVLANIEDDRNDEEGRCGVLCDARHPNEVTRLSSAPYEMNQTPHAFRPTSDDHQTMSETAKRKSGIGKIKFGLRGMLGLHSHRNPSMLSDRTPFSETDARNYGDFYEPYYRGYDDETRDESMATCEDHTFLIQRRAILQQNQNSIMAQSYGYGNSNQYDPSYTQGYDNKTVNHQSKLQRVLGRHEHHKKFRELSTTNGVPDRKRDVNGRVPEDASEYSSTGSSFDDTHDDTLTRDAITFTTAGYSIQNQRVLDTLKMLHAVKRRKQREKEKNLMRQRHGHDVATNCNEGIIDPLIDELEDAACGIGF